MSATRVTDAHVLGIGVGGRAILPGLTDEDVQRIHHHHVDAFETEGLGAAAVACTQRSCYSHLLDIITMDVGMAMTKPGATPFAAISIALIQPRMLPARCVELATVPGMKRARGEVSRQYGASPTVVLAGLIQLACRKMMITY